ncbi:2OG-Fe(II) oxygenase family protein [Dongia sp.]|uniref:2OG-Fe(II) oxygenase family protein n=1 Tax=Dongia sp. TaxID=1977262 RepID=UPI0037522B4C
MNDLAVKPGPSTQPGKGFLPPIDLAPGDRFPNFILPDQSGAGRSFLERARGNPILLIGDSDNAGLQALEQANLAAAGVDCMALVQEMPEAAARRAEQFKLGLPLLGDSAGKIREALRRMMGFAPRGAFAVLMDGNQRVIEARVDPDNPALVAWAIARARALPRPEAGDYLRGVAPVLLVPNVLTPGQCRALIDRWHELGNEEGHVYSVVKGEESRRIDKSMKSRRDHRIMDEAVLQELATVVGRRIGPELNKAFGFGKFRFDRFVVTCYDAERGDFFRRHRDNEAKATADRRFALTLNLNTEEYEGGGLIFPEYGPHRYNPPTGGAILFSCSLLHEALPITKGRRFTLLNFLRS